MKKINSLKKISLILLSSILAICALFFLLYKNNVKNSYVSANTLSSNINVNNIKPFATQTDDQKLAKNSSFTTSAIYVSTKEDAKAFLVNEISALGINANTYEILEEEFLTPQTGMDGNYSCKVKFISSGKSVKCDLLIEGFAMPAVLDFSKPSAIKACSASNATLQSDNGKLKMACTDSSYDDGFYLYFSTKSMTDKTFNAEDYRYFKVKYKTTCDVLSPSFQMYFFRPEDTVSPFRRLLFNVNNGSKEGHNLTLIIDLKVSSITDNAITVYDEDDGTITYIKVDDIMGEYTGEVGTVRFNFARNANCQRQTTVDYLGFFSSFDSAKTYVPDSGSFDDYAKALSSKPLNALWGDAKTLELAKNTALNEIGNTYGLSGSVIKVSEYTPSNENTLGKMVFDGVFKNNGKTEIIKNITLIIGKKPNDYKIIDFSSQETLNKITRANIDYELVDDADFGKSMYMISNEPATQDGFYFHVGFGNPEEDDMFGCPNMMDSFMLQDYRYVVFRYKRVGIGGGQMFFWTKNSNLASVPYLELYFGKYDNHCYTSILCTDVKDFDNPVIYNFDETIGEVESVLQLSSYGINKASFSGEIENIRFNFARKAYLDREAWIDFIAFFPTFDEAKSYFALNAVESYNGEDLDYFGGVSESVALRTIKEIYQHKIGDEFSVEVQKISYVAPIENTTNGQIKVNLTVKLGDKVIAQKNNLVFNIKSITDKTQKDFVFANPYFVREIFGTNYKNVGFEKMVITDYMPKFTYNVKESEQFYVEDKPFVAFKVEATTDKFTFTLNGQNYLLNTSLTGENILVLDLLQGKFYKDGISIADCNVNTPYGKVKSFGMSFDTLENVSVYNVSFFNDLISANSFDCTFTDSLLTDALSGLQSVISGKGAITAVSQLTAIKEVKKVIEESIGEYVLYDVDVVSYTDATLSSAGEIVVDAYIYSNGIYNSVFGTARLTFSIAQLNKPASNGQSKVENGVHYINDNTNANNQKWYNVSLKGHIFAGSDYITTTKALSDIKTIEWWMATENADGTYNILSNEGNSFVVSTVDGKLYFKNGDITFTTDSLNIFDGNLRHFAIVISSGVNLYIDGTLYSSYIINGSSLQSVKVIIGQGFIGNIGDIRIWNTVRTASDILNNKNNYLNGNETGLIASWRLDEQFYLNSLEAGYVAGTTGGNTYPNAEEYFAKCMGYKDYTANGNHGIFYSDGWYNLENIITDYTVIQISDTQSYMFEHPEYYNQMYGWMMDSQQDLNIVMVDHLGDVCQDSTYMQWKFTFDAIKEYIEGNMPYNIALGNHDYFSPYTGIGSEFRDKDYYDMQFTFEMFTKQYEGIDWARFGGTFDGKTMDNMYMFIEAGNPIVQYMVITLEYGPRQEVINWASELIEKYTDYKVIVLTHCYYDMYGTRSTFNARRTTAFSDAFEGEDLWNEFVDKYSNVVMINCGHSQNNQVQAYVNSTSKGTQVVQILSDPSAMIESFPSDLGIIELMCFTNDGLMHTYYYSPLLKMFRETQFEVTFDMSEALSIS